MIKLHRSVNGQFYYTVCAKNNKVLLTSETYKRKANMVKGLKAVTTSLGVTKVKIIDLTK